MSAFSAKLDGLLTTIDRALKGDCTSIATALNEAVGRPTIAVGSGGSAITAAFFATCRRALGHGPTWVQTPLEFVFNDDIRGSDVWLFSAGGSNADILAACGAALANGCATLNIVTRKTTSDLTKLAQKSNNARVQVTPVADSRDGFLATHSLVAAITQLLKATTACLQGKDDKQLEATWRSASAAILSAEARSALKPVFATLGPQDTLLVLSDPRLAPLGTLIETSAWEAALCAVQRTDFRNFAHGRQTWLAQRPAQSFVLALTGARTRSVWEDIRTVLPDDIRTHSLDFAACDLFENARALLTGLTLVEAMGYALGIDPAHPGAAQFGGAILRAPSLLSISWQLEE